MDWNDLHQACGLDAVREQLASALDAANDAALPPSPSSWEPPPAPAAAATGGAGEGQEWSDETVHRRFALLEGEKKVFDLVRRKVIGWGAFEALVTTGLAKAWLNRGDKKLIDAEEARHQAAEIKLSKKLKGERGTVGMDPMERYVYLDGTQDVWDRQL
ncbi:hypothetical protein EQG41_20750, partial [Billgrantia azerbaijanica]